MALEIDHHCPSCGEERAFYRAAAMNLHLGEKEKWGCTECGFRFVTVDGIDTAE